MFFLLVNQGFKKIKIFTSKEETFAYLRGHGTILKNQSVCKVYAEYNI